MGNPQTTIEINGKRYDARTGRIITGQSQSVQSKPTSQPAKPAGQPVHVAGNIDGFARPHAVRKTAGTSPASRVQKSHTLRRSSVKKPQVVHTVTHPKTHPESSPVAHQTSVTQPRPTAIPKERMHRIKTTPKSRMVTRFHQSELDHKPAKTKHVDAEVVKAVSTVVAEQPTAFSDAVEQATSHEMQRTKKTPLRHRAANKLRISTRALNTGAFSVALVLFIGYFGYNNAPNLSMRMAAMRADVPASVPNYTPSGFSLNRQIKYKPGEVTIGYRSNSDDRNFTITQAASQWDSEALKQNFIASKEQVQTVQDKGKTIYIYENNNATWVDGGIWFKVEGDSLLNGEQLSRLASSL